MPPRRTVFHVDMDAFYAAIEQRDQPELRGLPVIVGGARKRGVVSTASYEARRFGVRSAMPMAEAMRRCPEAVVLPVRMDRYVAVSHEIMAVFARFSPLVEPLSLDEAFLDMTGTEALCGPPLDAAQAIRHAVLERTSLTCSVGVAENKFLAKLASDLNKPDGMTVIPHGGGAAFIADLPVQRLWGVGPRTADLLTRSGMVRIGQVAKVELAALTRIVGASHAAHLQALARAQDDRPVVPDREAKSIGSEETLAEDVTGETIVRAIVRRHCERVAVRLRSSGLHAGQVRVKVRYSEGFRLVTRECALPQPCDDAKSLQSSAQLLLRKLDLRPPIRLVGVAAGELTHERSPVQPSLFDGESTAKRSRLEHTIDSIRERFGDVIRRADD